MNVEWGCACLPRRVVCGTGLSRLVGAPTAVVPPEWREREATLQKEVSRLSGEVTRLRQANLQLERGLAQDKDTKHIHMLEKDPGTAKDVEDAQDVGNDVDVNLKGLVEESEAECWCCGDGDTVALRQIIGIVVLLVLTICFAATEPRPTQDSSMSREEHRTLGVLCVVSTLWLTEVLPIPITGLLVGPLLFLCEVQSLSQALSAYMGNLTIILFGSHFIALAMERHGLDRRVATFATSLSCVKGIPWRERLALTLTGWTLSMWVSNTGATNILMPIALSTLGAARHRLLEDGAKERTLRGTLLSVAYGCNSGGMGTLVGTPPNIVAQTFLEKEGLDVGFLSWMLVGIPASALVCLTAFLVLQCLHRPTRSDRAPSDAESREKVAEQPKPLGPITWGEKVVLGSFFLTVFFWVFPSIYKLAGGPSHTSLKKMLPAGVVVILGSLPLHLVPDMDRRTRILPWSAARKADWGVIMLVGGGVALGRAMLDTGLAKRCAEGFLEATGVNNVSMLTFIVILITIFATEVTSNTATTNVMVPIVLAVSKAINPDPGAAAGPVIGVAFAASCAFMMPMATPPNYIIMDTGHVQMQHMAKAGILINVLCVGLLWLVLRTLIPSLWPTS